MRTQPRRRAASPKPLLTHQAFDQLFGIQTIGQNWNPNNRSNGGLISLWNRQIVFSYIILQEKIKFSYIIIIVFCYIIIWMGQRRRPFPPLAHLVTQYNTNDAFCNTTQCNIMLFCNTTQHNIMRFVTQYNPNDAFCNATQCNTM